jgi:hypothetical protein
MRTPVSTVGCLLRSPSSSRLAGANRGSNAHAAGRQDPLAPRHTSTAASRGSASTSSPPAAASPSSGRAPLRRRCPPAAGRTPTSTGRASTTTRRCSASRPEPAPAPAKPAAALPQVAYVVVFETGGSPWEAAVGPTFGCGRPKCRIFVSHALVGKIAQDHVTTDAAGPTPSIDDDPRLDTGPRQPH